MIPAVEYCKSSGHPDAHNDFAGGSLLVSPDNMDLGWLSASTLGLYGGGVVFDDIFDAKLDAKERPERARSSRRISKMGAIVLAVILFFQAFSLLSGSPL